MDQYTRITKHRHPVTNTELHRYLVTKEMTALIRNQACKPYDTLCYCFATESWYWKYG